MSPAERFRRHPVLATGIAAFVVAVIVSVAMAIRGDHEVGQEVEPQIDKIAHAVPCATLDAIADLETGGTVKCQLIDGQRKWWRETMPTTAAPPVADRDGDGLSDDRDYYPDDPQNRPGHTISLDCDQSDGVTREFELWVNLDLDADFAEVWKIESSYCRADDISPLTALEVKAHEVSGYDDRDISTLYTICGENDPGDPYAEAGFRASSEQIPEIKAALILCPKHPQAAKWRQAVKRGEVDEKLRADGRIFEDGTYLVRKEIKPGGYFVTDVKNCYWERQDRSGNIIDNNFVTSARRVEVTIRSSDYGFMSQGCGEWRPR